MRHVTKQVTGVCVSWDSAKGTGILEDNLGNTVHCHKNEIAREFGGSIAPGTEVKFDLIQRGFYGQGGGLRAAKVRPL